MPLERLRSVVSIIPQEPVLFRGSLRAQLDPFEVKDDKVVWDALEAVQLRPFVERTVWWPVASDRRVRCEPERRSAPVGMLCARHPAGGQVVRDRRGDFEHCGFLYAFGLPPPPPPPPSRRRGSIHSHFVHAWHIRHSQDRYTDKLIQDTINKSFAGRSLIIIAHNLHTIMHVDWVCVLKDGHLEECGSPRDLVDGMAGVGAFQAMVNASGDEEAERLRSLMQPPESATV